jgi:hypothetical protein
MSDITKMRHSSVSISDIIINAYDDLAVEIPPLLRLCSQCKP